MGEITAKWYDDQRKPDRFCHKDGCDAGARWQAFLHLECPQPGGMKNALVLNSTIEVCDDHQEDVRPWLLSDANKEVIRTSLMEEGGYAEPDFLTARIEFKPVHREPIKVRTIHACDRAGCGKLAHWQIRQVFDQPGSTKRASALTNMFVCHEHKRMTKPRHLDKQTTLAMLRKNGIYDGSVADRVKLEFVPLAEVTITTGGDIGI